MLINRAIKASIKEELQRERSRIVIIYGARQIGKTTLVNEVLKDFSDKKLLYVTGDNIAKIKPLSSSDFKMLEEFVFGYDILFVDEAQRIPQIGLNLKLLYDHIPSLKIIVTGSSSLDLASSVKEALTGRNWSYKLYPISFLELSQINNPFELKNNLEERLVFGGYPNVLNIKNRNERIKYINQIADNYLYKDILEIENIKYPTKIRDLLRLLAFQIGSEVSMQELATSLQLNQDTVVRYIDLLEKSFVIFTLGGFSRNLRKEVNRKPKIYFYDLGIRNAIVGNLNYLDERNDIGALWENFLIIERMKRNEYTEHYCNSYFWRTYTGAELDYVEEYGGRLYGYEFKWTKTSKAPQSWIETYEKEKASFECFNKDNFLKFICE
jgi:predicted AAA+ superfamily ATPase